MLLSPMASKTVIAASVAVFRSVNLIYKTFYIISVIFLNLVECTQDFNTPKKTFRTISANSRSHNFVSICITKNFPYVMLFCITLHKSCNLYCIYEINLPM